MALEQLVRYFFFKIYLFILDRGKGRERNITVWLPLTCPLLGTWPATQACVLTGNWTGIPLVCRPALNPLSHTSQGWWGTFLKKNFELWPVWLSWLGIMLQSKRSPVRFLVRAHCRFGPWSGRLWEAPDWYFCLTSMFLSLCFSLPSHRSKINMHVLEWG